jgi:hypothetical protein
MGCYIHLYIEVLTENGWELYSHPSIRQDYELFAKMAGVRNDGGIEPISLPKGLPEDISYIVGQASADWGADGHSHSWLDSDEIEELRVWNDCGRGEHGSSQLWGCRELHHDILKHYLEGDYFDEPDVQWIKDTRFVFWFDN